MSSDKTTAAQTLRLRLNLPEGLLQTDVTLATGPQRLGELAAVLLDVSQKAAGLGSEVARKMGRQVTCAAGCGACCRQLVPLSIPEVVLVNDIVESMPAAVQEQIRHRFAAATVTVHRAGLQERIERVQGMQADDATMVATMQEYFALGIACPFLHQESCGIYPFRPSRCREYLVVSDPARCADPFGNQVSRLPVPVRLSEALARVWASLVGDKPRLIGLPYALDWLGRNAQVRYAAVELRPVVMAVAQYLVDRATG